MNWNTTKHSQGNKTKQNKKKKKKVAFVANWKQSRFERRVKKLLCKLGPGSGPRSQRRFLLFLWEEGISQQIRISF